MGIVMLQGMVVSNSILIVDFANVLREGRAQRAPGGGGCVPDPVAADFDDVAGDGGGSAANGVEAGKGSEAYAPLARVIIGGLLSSIVLTIFVVPAAYLLFYEKDPETNAVFAGQEVKS